MSIRTIQTKTWIFIFCFILASTVVGAQNMEEVSLESFIEEAARNNPKIQEAFNEWKAAEHKIKRVKSLDDPMASYGKFGEEIQTRVGPQEQKYGVSQKI